MTNFFWGLFSNYFYKKTVIVLYSFKTGSSLNLAVDFKFLIRFEKYHTQPKLHNTEKSKFLKFTKLRNFFFGGIRQKKIFTYKEYIVFSKKFQVKSFDCSKIT